eukprot:scaffold71630_cov17-Tisochrysis_lutea.AAC.1
MDEMNITKENDGHNEREKSEGQGTHELTHELSMYYSKDRQDTLCMRTDLDTSSPEAGIGASSCIHCSPCSALFCVW